MKRVLLCLLSLLLSPLPAWTAEELQAGAASVDITPPTGFAMWGYAARKDQPSLGVRDPLRARALVLAAGDKRLALVSLDLGRAPTRASMAAIRRRIRIAGIEHVFLVASHTHHGPVLELDNWPSAKNSYVRQLEQKIGAVILDAAKAVKPARIGIASKQTNLNRNRHSKRDDAPVDRELLVLRIEDRDGKPIAHVVNFAAHPTLRDIQDRKFSADYPGILADLVEKETKAPCLFLQGAAGDLSAKPTGDRSADQFGQDLGHEVLALVKGVHSTAIPPALEMREEDFAFKPRLNLSNPLVRLPLNQAFFPELISFYEREYREGVRPHLSVALLDGRIGFVGVSGEFFCGHSLNLKRRARLEHLFFLGYCNDYQQYFPTIEAASEGGYGTAPPVSSAEIGAGERIMDRALIHLYQMRGKLLDRPALKE
ncbi:MAG TPA: neutral/alkaline non-lysosomal ceramidase N-terminal domain-containing protein [Gemmataceae bacterium]|nr:neutral/alkaline non-lysosomal ceramidase N-terminal domain-containing protein [Gemmataceae bacterium]